MALLRAARSAGAFRSWLAARFTPRPDCPVPEPFVEPSVEYDCYDGRLPSGRPVELVLGHEPGGRANEASYVGVFVPGAATAPALTLRVRARGDWWGRRAGGPASTHILVAPPEDEPVRADREGGGLFVAWRLATLPTPAKVDACLRAVDAALTAGP